MFRWSSSIVNSAASDVIWLEELGTMSLDNSVNQLSNVIDPVRWNDFNFILNSISVYAIFK